MHYLAGRQILLAEDEYLIAMELRQELEKNGAKVLGPAASVDETLNRFQSAVHVDAAVLDVDLGGKNIFSFTDALQERSIPFIFISGFGRKSIQNSYPGAVMLDKPVDFRRLHNFLGRVLGTE